MVKISGQRSALINVAHTDRSIIRQVMEYVDSVDRLRSSLAKSENEVDPLLQILADIVRLECFAMELDEQARILVRPRRESHGVDFRSVLLPNTCPHSHQPDCHIVMSGKAYRAPVRHDSRGNREERRIRE